MMFTMVLAAALSVNAASDICPLEKAICQGVASVAKGGNCMGLMEGMRKRCVGAGGTEDSCINPVNQLVAACKYAVSDGGMEYNEALCKRSISVYCGGEQWPADDVMKLPGNPASKAGPMYCDAVKAAGPVTSASMDKCGKAGVVGHPKCTAAGISDTVCEFLMVGLAAGCTYDAIVDGKYDYADCKKTIAPAAAKRAELAAANFANSTVAVGAAAAAVVACAVAVAALFRKRTLLADDDTATMVL